MVTKAIYDFAIGLLGKNKNVSIEEYLLKFTNEEEQRKNSIKNLMSIFGKKMPVEFKNKLKEIK